MALSFTDELPEGVVKRRTKDDEILDAVMANEGRWALVKNVEGIEAAKLNAKATDVRAALKKIVAKAKEPLQYEVRTPGAGIVQGFVRSPTVEQYDAGGFDTNGVELV